MVMLVLVEAATPATGAVVVVEDTVHEDEVGEDALEEDEMDEGGAVAVDAKGPGRGMASVAGAVAVAVAAVGVDAADVAVADTSEPGGSSVLEPDPRIVFEGLDANHFLEDLAVERMLGRFDRSFWRGSSDRSSSPCTEDCGPVAVDGHRDFGRYWDCYDSYWSDLW